MFENALGMYSQCFDLQVEIPRECIWHPQGDHIEQRKTNVPEGQGDTGGCSWEGQLLQVGSRWEREVEVFSARRQV